MPCTRPPALRCYGLFAALWLLIDSGAAAMARDAAVSPPDTAVAATAPQGSGIVVSSVRWSASGYIIDVRFRITDPKQAVPFMDRRVPAYLIEPKSGTRLMVPVSPTIGALRQVAKPTNKDRTYFLLFANPGRFVKPGSTVSLHIGDRKIDGLRVE